MKRILIVDDERSIRVALKAYLENSGAEVREASGLEEARRALSEGDLDILFLDVYLPDGNGVEFLDVVRETDPSLPVVMMTGQGTIPMAVEAMRKGADHFLTKPLDVQELEVYLEKSLQIGTMRRANRSFKEMPPAVQPYFGEGSAWMGVVPLIEAACKHKAAVLLRGETGTGKGVLARHIHGHSPVSREPFVELNCAGLKPDFLETELFGHSKGAFTGAIEAKEGLLERAHRGTLFLDEIGDMDPGTQAKFLKVLEEKRFRPLGRVDEKVSDFRLISATNQDLEGKIAAGSFRRDLFYRINTLSIELPPLRARLEELPSICRHILRSIAGGRRDVELPGEAVRVLASYAWPGNLRELHNVLERAWILSDGNGIRAEHLAHLSPRGAAASGEEAEVALDLAAAERRHIIVVLRKVKGNVPEAARILGVSRPTLYRKIQEQKIDLGEIR